MVPWEKHRSTLSQIFKSISLCDTLSSNTRISQVPITRDRRFDEATANEYNSELYSRVLVGDKSMLLAVAHEAKGRQCKKQKMKSRETKLWEVRKVINLFELACRFCVAFTGSMERDLDILSILMSHERSLRCVAAVARVLRDITARFVDIQTINGKFVPPHERSWGNIGLDSNVSNRNTTKVVLEDIVRGLADRQGLLTIRSLHMTPENFEKQNMSIPPAGRTIHSSIVELTNFLE